jgi:hypothetical protein
MTNNLTKLRIDEISVVDDGANPGTEMLIAKRNADLHKRFEDDPAALLDLIKRADAGDRAAQDEWHAYKGAPPLTAPAPQPRAVYEGYRAIEKQGQALRAADPALTPEQAFTKAFEAAAPELRTLAKSWADDVDDDLFDPADFDDSTPDEDEAQDAARRVARAGPWHPKMRRARVRKCARERWVDKVVGIMDRSGCGVAEAHAKAATLHPKLLAKAISDPVIQKVVT